MKKYGVFGFVILMAFSYSAFSYDGCQSPADDDLSPCLSLTNLALKDIYDELMNVIQTPMLDEHEKSELRKDELQWLKLRDQQCELRSNTKLHSIDEWMHSIEADKTKSRCVVKQTNIRIADLEKMKKKKEGSIKQLGGEIDASKDELEAPIIPNNGQNILAFIPKGYAIFEKIEKDLNGDGRKDIAAILRPVSPNEFGPRPFLILLEQGGGFVLSARNDHIAPNGDTGGVSNPYGADSLKSKDKLILIEDTGGDATGVHGTTLGFGLKNSVWYLVSSSEWGASTNEGSGICENAEAPKLSKPWHCWKHEVYTDLITGQVTESWLAHNDDTNQDRTKKVRRRVEVKKLIMLNELENGVQ